MLEPSPDPRDITGADQRELAQAVRELMLCAGLTTVTRPEMTRARALVDEASRVLAQHSTQRVDRLSYEEPSLARATGHPFTYAASNPAAVPLEVTFEGDTLRGTVALGPLFEGPPDSVHGGTISWLFDSLFGLLVQATLKPSVTGTLTVRYLSRTPLRAPLEMHARILDQTGRKTIAEAWLAHAGQRTAEAQATFIEIPRDQHMT
ncbi:MAG TPA: PaaI family thioesterase [Nocardioides sp.]